MDPSVEQCDPAGRAVDKRGLHDEPELRERLRFAGDVLGAAQLDDRPGARVFAADDVGIEHRDEGVEVSVPRGGEEGLDDVLLCGRVGVMVFAPRMRRRPRLASWRAASGERSRMPPISSKGTENLSWRT